MDLSEKIMLNWDISPDDLLNLTEETIKRSKEINDNLINNNKKNNFIE